VGTYPSPPAADPVLGDLLCLTGTVLYGVCNVSAEYLIKRYGQFEYIAFFASFALPISLVQTGILEGARWSQTLWTPAAVGLLVGFAACMFAVSTLIPVFLALAGSTALNLSLLATDVYGLLASIFIFGAQVWERLSSYGRAACGSSANGLDRVASG